MEQTDVSHKPDEQVPEEPKQAADQDTEDVSKETEDTCDEIPTIEHSNDDEVVPSTTPKPSEEQETCNETTTAMSASVSPGRADVPFGVNDESDKEQEEEGGGEAAVDSAENAVNNKRGFENDDEQVPEDAAEQPKRLKTSEPIDEPPVVSKESDAAVEV